MTPLSTRGSKRPDFSSISARTGPVWPSWGNGAAAVSNLTPQELQIAMLLAEGRTTREAAAALFLSPKTIEYHLRNAYRKLGVRSRQELAAALDTAG